MSRSTRTSVRSLRDTLDFVEGVATALQTCSERGLPFASAPEMISARTASEMLHTAFTLRDTLAELKAGLIGSAPETYEGLQGDTQDDDILTRDMLLDILLEEERLVDEGSARAACDVAEECVAEFMHDILGGVNYQSLDADEADEADDATAPASAMADLNELIELSVEIVQRVQFIVDRLES